MARRYCIAILVILLSVGMLSVQVAAQTSKTSKSSKSKVVHKKKKSRVKAVRTPQKLVIRSACAWVEDQQTGELLIQKRATAVLPIASITKLMTAMVTLDAQLDLQKLIAIEPEDVDTLRHSHSRLRVGTPIARGDALLLALMSSENRCAHALGRTYPGGIDAFIAAMNAKAQSLGLTDTHFQDPVGLSSGNVSTAQELARMVDAAYQYPLIREFTTREDAVVQLGYRTMTFRNSNRLVRSPRWQIGLSKTGFIDEAGRCLVMQAQVAQRPVLIVLLDAHGKLTRFADADRIKRWMEGPPPPRQKQRV
ncbi:MAG: D-alanyl-D-alanine endopeptidase [Syntrophales bacterium]|jgi:serine-type D-Ala-D-Ala endopeptidase (penicillin-binding protein 7)